MQGNIYVGEGTVLYSDSGKALMTVIEDTIGKHDTVYGCCSNPNNMLRYGVITTESLVTTTSLMSSLSMGWALRQLFPTSTGL